MSLPHSSVLMEDGPALPPLCMEVRPNEPAYVASTLPPGYGPRAVPRPQEPWSGKRTTSKTATASQQTPTDLRKKGVLSGLPDSSAQDHAAWPLSPIQIGRVFAHRHPGRRARGINTQAAIFESCSCDRCLFGVRGFISDLIHERSLAIVCGLRLSVLFDSVKSKLSELVAAQAIPPI